MRDDSRPRVRRAHAAAAAAALALAAAAIAAVAWIALGSGSGGSGLSVALPPDGSTYFGVELDWAADSPAAFSGRLGRTPAVFGADAGFPLSAADRRQLGATVSQVADAHGKLMLTLKPWSGLGAVTRASARELAETLAIYNRSGVDVFVRFAPDMNGSWYAWGQRPAAYVRAFRTVAEEVHRIAPGSTMVWAPDYAGGYPFGGRAADRTTAGHDFAALDTNHDGRVTMTDDPYAPFYPGDPHVDWVALTYLHSGSAWPWGENEVPEKGRAVAQLTGRYTGSLGNERALPDFYEQYAVGHDKPFAITQTSALFNADHVAEGASNLAIKSGWWSQLFSSEVAARLPRLKLLMWVERMTFDASVGAAGAHVDWRATADPSILEAFRAAIPSRYVFASG